MLRYLLHLKPSIDGATAAPSSSDADLLHLVAMAACSPSHNEKNCRLSRFIQISHNPPPLAP